MDAPAGPKTTKKPTRAAAAAAVSAAAALLVCTLPRTTGAAAAPVSERQEVALGRRMSRQLEAIYPVVSDTPGARRVEQIGRRLAAASGRPRLDWQFRVLQHKSANAVSLPGRVYVFTGMLDLVGDDTDALAGVIAHEVAHTTARHARKELERGVTASLLRSLVFGQSDEYEADRLAVRYLKRTGYDPGGMIRLFRKFQKKDGRGRDHALWIESHPGNVERIAQVRRLIERRRPPAAAEAHPRP
jgi:predicted Zn-dependent protease